MSLSSNEVINDREPEHRIILCPECGAPEQIAKGNLWLNSGVMVQSINLSKRMGFIESDNLDPLYNGIGEIIGMPINHLVVDVARRHTLDLYRNLIQPEIRGMLRNKVMGLDFVAEFMATTGQLNGNGKYQILDFRYEQDENDYTLTTIAEPFSLPFATGINIGCSEVITEKQHKATCKEISAGLYEIRVYISEHGRGLEGLLPTKEYRHRDGDIDLERCGTCGGPKALSAFKWHLDRGVIINSLTGRRLKIADPCVQDSLFEELERELGEYIPRAVVEAQRRLTKSGLYSFDEISEEEGFRTQLALRGMGNLKEMKIGTKGLRMRIDNAANCLMAVGMVQGLFETAMGIHSQVEWQLSENGDLEAEVSPY